MEEEKKDDTMNIPFKTAGQQKSSADSCKQQKKNPTVYNIFKNTVWTTGFSFSSFNWSFIKLVFASSSLWTADQKSL